MESNISDKLRTPPQQTALCFLLMLMLVLATPNVDMVSHANCQFAFDLYKNLTNTAGGRNVVLSPLCLSTALAMAYLGSKHDLHDELGTLLHYMALEDVHIANMQLLEALRDPSNNYTLDMASAAFISHRHEVQSWYKEAASRFYDAQVFQLDFVENHVNATAELINEWIQSQTQDRIQNFFHSGSIDSTIVLLLVNAMFFKGWWKYDFDQMNTRVGQFRLNNIAVHEMEFMKQIGRFYYWSNQYLDCRILELPYVGDEVSMFIILPNAVLGIYGLEEKLNYDIFREITSRCNRQAGLLTIYIPKVRLDVKINLKNSLYHMGLKDAFMPSADFSKIGRNLYLTDIVHQATFELSEDGTTGAAALGIQISLAGPGPDNEFRFDHPFIFIIEEKVTENIIFMGRMLRSPIEGAEVGEFNPDLLFDSGSCSSLWKSLLNVCFILSLYVSDVT